MVQAHIICIVLLQNLQHVNKNLIATHVSQVIHPYDRGPCKYTKHMSSHFTFAHVIVQAAISKLTHALIAFHMANEFSRLLLEMCETFISYVFLMRENINCEPHLRNEPVFKVLHKIPKIY